MKNIKHIDPFEWRTKLVLAVCATLFPLAGYAQSARTDTQPIHMSLSNYVFLAALLAFALSMFYVFQRRFKKTSIQLQDITNELGTARQRLSDTTYQLEQTQKDLHATTNRYQGILFDASVGMFQTDTEGKCSYVNSALQEMSGLYPKKAMNEGFASAVHPDDRAVFEEQWNAFVSDNTPFSHTFRFQRKRGRQITDLQVHCRANKVFNAKKEVESYIGWVTDMSTFHQRQLEEQARTRRFSRFVNETVEGYFQLIPENPIPLSTSTSKMADAILNEMRLADCNSTFASIYGASAADLEGKTISDLQGGCGPFKNKQSLIEFAENGYKFNAIESVRQDSNGTRINLLNNVIGIIEDEKLVGIWGAHQNVSRQKREQAELSSQIKFMQRIINTLPADVNVKDTRCRYLYASKKLADRTGIPQEDWIGKTIFEVMPGTAKDQDQKAIETMKSGKLSRTERRYEAKGKSGWMETVQVPLVSKEGLVEGVIGLSIDISERRLKEEEVHHYSKQLETQLSNTRNDLSKARDENNKTTKTLSEAIQKLKVAEAEKTNREHQFEQQLEERQQIEETLRHSEEVLMTRQRQLEEQLSSRLSELEAETDKRKKWEELLSIRDAELKKIDNLAIDLKQQLAETEEFLQSTQEQVIHITAQHSAEMEKAVAERKAIAQKLAHSREELEQSDAKWNQQIEALSNKHRAQFENEHKGRQAAEKQLAKTADLLEKAQAEMKQSAERYAAELEKEVSERKAAAEQLMRSMEDLDELRQQFNLRIEEETKSIKQELAQKQIREKALRQHEKDLEERIKELESTLQMKAREFAEQLQAREGAEVQKKQIEHRLEQLTKRQQELVARETQKLQLHIAEIRLEEVKLRKQAGDLQSEKESLEEHLKERSHALEKALEQSQRNESMLEKTKSDLKQLSNDQSTLIAAETESLRQQLDTVKQAGERLQQQFDQLQQDKKGLEKSLSASKQELDKAREEQRKLKKTLQDTERQLEKLTDDQSDLLARETDGLRNQLQQLMQASEQLKERQKELQEEKQSLEDMIDTRNADLSKAAQEYHKLIDAYTGSQAKLKQLTENQETMLAEKTKDLRNELKALQEAQSELIAKGEQLENCIDGQKQRIEKLSSGLDTETAKRKQTEQELKDLQQLMDSSEDNAKALMEEKTRGLKSRIEQLTENETELTKELHTAQQTITERDEALTAMDTERKQAEDRMAEIEQRLAGIREEHQEELKKSMAEIQEVSKLNESLVDDLNESVQSALNPVVKTAILMENADNLSEDQKNDIVRTNYTCRKLIDMMNYRCELTHIADGSDEMAIDRCDIHGLMTDIDRQFSHRAETKKLFFAVSFAQYQAAHNVPKIVETDELKVRKVLAILLGYAVEMTDKGRLGLHATRKSSAGEVTNISFELAYTGINERDELMNSIFGENSDKNDVVDVNYGLTLARRYIGMLNGEVSLEYRSGGITSLTVQFPFKKVSSDAIVTENDDTKRAGAA